MSAHRSPVMLSMAALLGIAAIAPAAFAQGNCETYGKLALQQQKDNEAAKCGLTGQEWSTDLKGHIDWCTKVGPDKWKPQLQQRTAALEACKAKK
jgi:hypothetical protein